MSSPFLYVSLLECYLQPCRPFLAHAWPLSSAGVLAAQCIGGMSSFCNSVQSSEPYVEIQLQLPASTHLSTATDAMGPTDNKRSSVSSFKIADGPKSKSGKSRA